MNSLKLALASTALATTAAFSVSAQQMSTDTCIAIEREANSGIISDGSQADAAALNCARMASPGAPAEQSTAIISGDTDSDADAAALEAAEDDAVVAEGETSTGAGIISSDSGGDLAAMVDDDFSMSAESAFMGNTVVGANGTVIGEVVEVREAQNGAVRLFVDLDDDLNAMAERVAFTTRLDGDATGEIQLGVTADEFLATIS